MKRLMLGLSMLVGGAVAAGSQTIACQPTGAKASLLRTQVVGYASDSDAAALRSDVGIGAIDTTTIAIVTADTVCDAVTRSINASAQHPRSTSFIVVKFGAFFAACAPEGDPIGAVYLLDDHYIVKTVLVST